MYGTPDGATTPDIKTEAALGLWNHLFADERGLLHIFAATRDGDKLVEPRTANFHWPAKGEDAARWALQKSEEGREVYFCAHLLSGPERRKENAAGVLALWGDLDGAPVPNLDLRPSAVVQSSPGRFHVYWRLTDEVPPEVAEALNKRLAGKVGADPAGFDLTQLLRVPGTVNHKYPERPVVRLLDLGGEPYVPGELDARLPKREPKPEPTEALGGDVPPVRLGEAALRMWHGEDFVAKEDGSLDRSASLVQIARALAWRGATEPTVVAALRERDIALGWIKAADRGDGGEKYYTCIARDACAAAEKAQAEEPEGAVSGFISSSPPMHTDDEMKPSMLPQEPGGGDVVWFYELGEPKPREYVVEAVGVKGYPIILFGAGGVAKSFVALAAGVAIASASGADQWLGLKVQKHGYVLYLDFELDEEEQHRRVRDLCNGLGVPVPRKLGYLSGVGLSREVVFAKARRFVEKYEAVAVVVDSVGLAMVGDMERGKDVLSFFTKYIDPLRRLGATPILVDHESKTQPGEKRKGKTPIGSVYKGNLSRSVLQFILDEYDEDNSALDIQVRQSKTNWKPIKPFGVRITFEAGKVSIERRELPDEELMDEERVPVRERIVTALGIQPQTVDDLVSLTGADKGTIYNNLAQLKKDDKVVETGWRGTKKLYGLHSEKKEAKQDDSS